jgi:hypothetical protein
MVGPRPRNPFPARKSRLTPQGKTIAAGLVLLDVMEGKLEDKAAGVRLRSEVGLNWSLITALQYLCGQEAIAALASIPQDWQERGRTRADLVKAVLVAADAVANGRPDGQMLCASYLARDLKGVDWEAMAREFLTPQPDAT